MSFDKKTVIDKLSNHISDKNLSSDKFGEDSTKSEPINKNNNQINQEKNENDNSPHNNIYQKLSGISKTEDKKFNYFELYIKGDHGFFIRKGHPSPQDCFDLLGNKLQNLGLDKKHLHSLKDAFEFANFQHRNQIRASGEAYIFHPIEVCSILSEITIDCDSLIAAILHDTIEDTSATSKEINALFGDSVAKLVEGLTKIRKVKFSSQQEQLAENFRKMILAMAKDIRVVIIKLCDRLHNMRTIDSIKQPKRIQIARETLDIYAPLANRLGMFGVKSELEDLCLKHLKPPIYDHISKKVSQKRDIREGQINMVIDEISGLFKQFEFTNVQITGRSKHFFSIYKKMQLRKLSFEEIYDLYAFRVIVDSVKDCYAVLGLIHGKWKPQPGRFKDYIAMPKANLYQSLHTTVVGTNGDRLEIQIRTHKMHSICEYGVASHWEYKENGVLDNQNDLEKFRWLRQMMDWQHEITDSTEYLEALKVDLFEQEIFVFSPKGDVFRLPRGSTSLDFAFAVHTDVGLKTRSVKVNHRIQNLKHKLQNGDIVEVQTSESQLPGKDWINYVKTSKARSKIRAYLRNEQRTEYRQIGKHLMEGALEKEHSSIKNFFKNSKLIDKATRHFKSSNLDELILMIGYGKIALEEFLKVIRTNVNQNESSNKFAKSSLNLKPKLNKSVDSADKEFSSINAINENTFSNNLSKSKNKITVSGLDNVLVNIARCCSPVPGDKIVGYVTRSRGVSVHVINCSRALDFDPARKIDVEWTNNAKNTDHIVNLRIESLERHGLMADVASSISAKGVNIISAKVHLNKSMVGILNFQISIKSLQQLNSLIAKIEGIPEIISVSRTQ